MEGIYKVLLGSNEVGSVQVSRQGLYYQILCRVNIPKGSYYHLYAVSGNDSVDLGLCVPTCHDFGLSTKQPLKMFSSGKYAYVLAKKITGNCVPLFPDKPFQYLHRLKSGRFVVCEGIPSVIFSDSKDLYC